MKRPVLLPLSLYCAPTRSCFLCSQNICRLTTQPSPPSGSTVGQCRPWQPQHCWTAPQQNAPWRGTSSPTANGAGAGQGAPSFAKAQMRAGQEYSSGCKRLTLIRISSSLSFSWLSIFTSWNKGYGNLTALKFICVTLATRGLKFISFMVSISLSKTALHRQRWEAPGGTAAPGGCYVLPSSRVRRVPTLPLAWD